MRSSFLLRLSSLLFLPILAAPAAVSPATPLGGAVGTRDPDRAPRIVNIVNFIRGVEPRNPALDLVEPVRHQLELARKYRLPITFLLQYDALRQPRFLELLRSCAGDDCEIGGWFEVVQPLVERAGLSWRGRYPWDWHANVGFTIGYTPAERERLADVFMEDFKAAFGRYPRSVGSWFIDAHTLGYLANRYGVIASCMCREQVGNDGYTLWGGYWNGAYYPSRLNSFMPAQRADRQIPIVVFRMPNNDPIEQFASGIPGAHPGLRTLEPACSEGGGSPAWVRWYLGIQAGAPCLAFSHTQVGQENAFGWPRMEAGFTDQIQRVAEMAGRGEVRVETLERTARWFRSRFRVTPATAVTALQDASESGRGSVWFSSRFYRANFYWESGALCIRDIHLFDGGVPEAFLATQTDQGSCRYETLPIFDGLLWSAPETPAVLRPVRLGPGAARRALQVGVPRVRALGDSTLQLTWPVADGEALRANCSPDSLEIIHLGGKGSERWALEMIFPPARSPIVGLEDRILAYRFNGVPYSLRCTHGRFVRTVNPAGVLMLSEGRRLTLRLDPSEIPRERTLPAPWRR